ncbi:hypothetical protein [Psychrobacillus sp.]|uniref:hypothetical protein n=1 Tax=Psychrobacillus sp. TaxID=1871623 RepID=UPI0028BE58E6|nr:hypothetical protein [Psychrobacillus sp.]
MANIVKSAFKDKETKQKYKKGDSYKHKDAERVAFLVKKGFLEVSNEDESSKIKHTGGGWFELPNGEKVQGKDEALSALEALESGE